MLVSIYLAAKESMMNNYYAVRYPIYGGIMAEKQSAGPGFPQPTFLIIHSRHAIAYRLYLASQPVRFQARSRVSFARLIPPHRQSPFDQRCHELQ